MGLRVFLASVHEGKFTPGKYGEWRFDKRSYSTIPPPRHLGKPPPGIENELVTVLQLLLSLAPVGPFHHIPLSCCACTAAMLAPLQYLSHAVLGVDR